MTRPFLIAAAICGLLTSPTQALDVSTMTAAERQAFRAEVRSYLLENPEILVEAYDILDARAVAAQAADDAIHVSTNTAALFDDGYSWVGGNPDGDITLVEFLDYRCAYCRTAHAEVAELVETDGNIRLIVKEFPVLGEQSVLSARFAIAVQQLVGDAAYKQAHNALITFRGNVTVESLHRLATHLELDADAVIAHMTNDSVTDLLIQNRALGQQMQINGTPTFVMNTQMVRGYKPLDYMRDLAAELRAK